jgi:signal transduction histidine kinase
MTQRSDSHLAITVSDNGIGIAPEHLETIFERFNQRMLPRRGNMEVGAGTLHRETPGGIAWWTNHGEK